MWPSSRMTQSAHHRGGCTGAGEEEGTRFTTQSTATQSVLAISENWNCISIHNSARMMWFLNTFSYKQSCGDPAAQLARDILRGGAHAPVWNWRWGGLWVGVSMDSPQRPGQSGSRSRVQNQVRYRIAQWELQLFGEYEEWNSADIVEHCLSSKSVQQ